MIYLAYIVVAFTTVQLIVTLVNFVFRQKMKSAKQKDKLVTILIPARNEEKNIAHILRDLSAQDYHNYEVIVFDDDSTDNTQEVVKAFAQKNNKIRLIASKWLPNEWLGKNYACHSLALEAKGDYLLFLDADVRIKHNIIGKTVNFANVHRLNLLSIFPKQTIINIGEHATVPIMNYILLTLLPLILVKKTNLPSLAAANGQYMFFDRDNYMKLLPHKAMKNEKVEDIKIARYYKNNDLRVACLAAERDVKCRMYTNYGESINGFSKNVNTFFGDSTILAVLFWAITTVGFIPVYVVFGSGGLSLYLVTILFIRILVSIISNQSVSKNIVYLLAQHLSLGIIIFKSIKNKLKREHIWKGRNVLQS